jgi:hypothetical protein
VHQEESGGKNGALGNKSLHSVSPEIKEDGHATFFISAYSLSRGMRKKIISEPIGFNLSELKQKRNRATGAL